ncbi:MAG TPA: aldehyde dehydrogenase family protein [Gammaproteobacteria bacterium]|nr:MAG: aldehyde dehydrogenase family protein [Proteobacteria bacterium TMED51]HAU42652.1 aldehyde dehydrogenase family protein [Gammaproteobacteria bacterium]HBP84769.1 aldehyde dehydrogenase family protein [Gammaproteobacteria bacterium]
MKEHRQFYMNGVWTDPVSDDSIDVLNPATEEVVARIGAGTAEDVTRAVVSARKAFNSFSQTSKQERVELLTEVRNLYKKRFNDIAEAIREEMGAPGHLAFGAQTAVGLGHLKTAIRVLEQFEFEQQREKFLIRYEPIGVCGLITPWNWPINQIVSKIAPAIASGCTTLLKPSELSPISAHVIAEVIDEAGVPAGVFNLVDGFGPIVGEAMSAHPDIDMISFTGSTRGGVAVAKGSAETVKRVSQELGGKSANIVLNDAALEMSVRDGVLACMENTGQSCNAPTRMLVPKERHQEAIEIAKEASESITVGNPEDDQTQLGPVISDVQFNKVQHLIQSGIDEGAMLVTGGMGRPDGLSKGYFVKPTVFAEVTSDMSIFREEIFGPVLSISTYDDADEAVTIANDTPYGLAAYVSGEDPAQLMQFARRLRAGQVHLNYTGGGTDAPFGGFKQSGNGREKAEWGLEEFLECKAILGN